MLLRTKLVTAHPRKPRGSQTDRKKGRDESFQGRAEKPLGNDSHQTISKRLSECQLLIGLKTCFVLLLFVRNRRTAYAVSFSCVRTRRLLSLATLVRFFSLAPLNPISVEC